MQTLEIYVPDHIADTLTLTAHRLNWMYNDTWNAETLAASFLKHLIEDDLAADPHPHLRVVK